MSTATILVVEDERLVAFDIQRTLQKAGYTVAGTASSGPQAIQKAAETDLDLVLMDVRLSGEMSGIEAARRIRQVREVPIVYLTANGENEVLEQAKTTEPIAFILKPYEEQDLLRTIAVALHQYRTQQQRARQRAQDYQRQLQSLMAQLSLVEERERQRIATDIHDRISQTLAVCQMRLEALGPSLAPAPAREIEAVCRLLERTLTDTSSLIFELSPPVLHQLGLGAGLEWFAEKVQQQHGLRVQLHQSPPPLPLNADQRTALFRAACELINNVVKHARASRIHLALTLEAGRLHLSIEDDGIGLGPSAGQSPKKGHGGFGLFHIRERLRAWDGTLELGPAPGGGTRARLSLPVPGPNPPPS